MRLSSTVVGLFSSLHRPVRVLHTEGNDIHFNLALEQYLFEHAKVEIPTLFLWRNSPTIVIGKHQNPWKQCKVEEMKQDSIKLSRRKTGGGAVYHDLGNTCFSFLTPYAKDETLDYRSVNNKIILDAMSKLGIKAEVSGRNDLVTDGRKFSGSAYRLHLGGKEGQGKKSLHHGTIMFNVDFKALSKYLNPNKKKLESKGIDSVISRVVNLQELYPSLNHGIFCEALERSFASHYGQQQYTKQSLNLLDMGKDGIVAKNYERLRSWEWLYGECPYFKYIIEKKFDWGLIEITFEVENGKIHKCKIYSDCLLPDFISGLNDRLIGVTYDREGIEGLLKQLRLQFLQSQQLAGMSEDVCRWIQAEI